METPPICIAHIPFLFLFYFPLFITIDNRLPPNTLLFSREKDIFQQTALSDIQNMSKLRTYIVLKHDTKFEKYLLSGQNVFHRIALTRFRLSNHNLMVEKGRHQAKNLYDRTCPFCPNHIENEFHFLIECPMYKHLSVRLFNDISKITVGFYYPENEQFLFWFLHNNYNIAHLTARHIKLSMELRTFLLDRPRNAI